MGGSGQIIANSAGTGIHFISMKSNASCAAACTTMTGPQLKATQNFETINVGGAVNLPGVIFQAYWGKVTIGGSGNIGSAVGQTVDLSGAGTVTFGTKLLLVQKRGQSRVTSRNISSCEGCVKQKLCLKVKMKTPLLSQNLCLFRYRFANR